MRCLGNGGRVPKRPGRAWDTVEMAGQVELGSRNRAGGRLWWTWKVESWIPDLFVHWTCSLTSIIFSLSQAGVQSRTSKESSNRLSSQGTTWQGKIIGLCEKKESSTWYCDEENSFIAFKNLEYPGCSNLPTRKAFGNRRRWWSSAGLEFSWSCQGDGDVISYFSEANGMWNVIYLTVT